MRDGSAAGKPSVARRGSAFRPQQLLESR